MDYQKIINEIAEEIKTENIPGEVAEYIPELAKVPNDKFGIHMHCIDKGHYFYGDSSEKFSIQSIAKVFTLSLAARRVGAELWKRTDVEPSGDPFNSLTQLEYESGIPRNPLINAGALVVCDILLSEFDNPKDELLSFVKKLTDNDDIYFDEAVAKSEAKHGFRNAALVNLMKSFDNINNDTEEVLDLYFHTCSLSLSCKELAKAFMIYANRGELLTTGERILSGMRTKRINAVMQTCGFYDEAGEFAFRVGLPGKSGVGGGIAAVHPGYYSVAVWSPKLNPKGNSALGMRVLELLTTKTGLSVF